MNPPRDDVLTRICDEKRAHLARRKVPTPEAELIQRAVSAEAPRGFMQALNRAIADGEYGLIFALGGGAGFTLALVLMAGVREKLGLAQVPDAVKGTALGLLLAGILSVAFMGFAGLGS